MAEETAEIAEGAAEEQQAPPKKGKLVMIGGLAGGVLLGATAGLFVLGPHFAHKGAPAKAADKPAAQDAEHKQSETPSIYGIDNLVLNPAGSNGSRFLLMSVAMDVKDEAAVTLLKGRDAEIRDAILRLFGGKTAEELSEASSRDVLRKQLKGMLDTLIHPGVVRKVFFPQFVIQ